MPQKLPACVARALCSLAPAHHQHLTYLAPLFTLTYPPVLGVTSDPISRRSPQRPFRFFSCSSSAGNLSFARQLSHEVEPTGPFQVFISSRMTLRSSPSSHRVVLDGCASSQLEARPAPSLCNGTWTVSASDMRTEHSRDSSQRNSTPSDASHTDVSIHDQPFSGPSGCESRSDYRSLGILSGQPRGWARPSGEEARDLVEGLGLFACLRSHGQKCDCLTTSCAWWVVSACVRLLTCLLCVAGARMHVSGCGRACHLSLLAQKGR